MKSKQVRKLALSKETLQSLDEAPLRGVVAGALPPPTEGYRCTTTSDLC